MTVEKSIHVIKEHSGSGGTVDITDDVSEVRIDKGINEGASMDLTVNDYKGKYQGEFSELDLVKATVKDQKNAGYIFKIDPTEVPENWRLSCTDQMANLKKSYTGTATYSNQKGHQIIADLMSDTNVATANVASMDQTYDSFGVEYEQTSKALDRVRKLGDSSGEYKYWLDYDWNENYAEDWVLNTKPRDYSDGTADLTGYAELSSPYDASDEITDVTVLGKKKIDENGNEVQITGSASTGETPVREEVILDKQITTSNDASALADSYLTRYKDVTVSGKARIPEISGDWDLNKTAEFESLRTGSAVQLPVRGISYEMTSDSLGTDLELGERRASFGADIAKVSSEIDTTGRHIAIGATETIKSDSSPSQTDKLWLDTSGTPNVWKRYSNNAWRLASFRDLKDIQVTGTSGQALYSDGISIKDSGTDTARSLTEVTDRNAGNISETASLKYSSEHGADITSGHTSNDTSNVSGVNSGSVVYSDGTSMKDASTGSTRSLTELANRIADNISETAALKYASEHGADITSGHKSNDTSNVSGRSSGSVTYTDGTSIKKASDASNQAEVGADITGNHTSNDTSYVSGRNSATVKSEAVSGQGASDDLDSNINFDRTNDDVRYSASGNRIEDLEPGEAGADVTGSHTADDTNNVGGTASGNVMAWDGSKWVDINALQTGVTDGADVTGNNTANDVLVGGGRNVAQAGADETASNKSADTSAVGGTPAGNAMIWNGTKWIDVNGLRSGAEDGADETGSHNCLNPGDYTASNPPGTTDWVDAIKAEHINAGEITADHIDTLDLDTNELTIGQNATNYLNFSIASNGETQLLPSDSGTCDLGEQGNRLDGAYFYSFHVYNGVFPEEGQEGNASLGNVNYPFLNLHSNEVHAGTLYQGANSTNINVLDGFLFKGDNIHKPNTDNENYLGSTNFAFNAMYAYDFNTVSSPDYPDWTLDDLGNQHTEEHDLPKFVLQPSRIDEIQKEEKIDESDAIERFKKITVREKNLSEKSDVKQEEVEKAKRKPYSLNKMTSYLLKVCQDQQDVIEALESRVESLEEGRGGN